MNIYKIRMPIGCVIILGATLALSACTVANLHNNQSIKNINSYAEARAIIKPGMSMAQVEGKLGKPNNKSSMNGRAVWNYSQQTTAMAGPINILTGVYLPDSKFITVTFNTSARVSRVDYNEQTNRVK